MGGHTIIPLAVKASYSGSSSTTHNLSVKCEFISIVNRGASTVTFTINSISINVAPSETFSGYFRDFTSVGIVASDNYELIVSGR